jgi:hypothetical protein
MILVPRTESVDSMILDRVSDRRKLLQSHFLISRSDYRVIERLPFSDNPRLPLPSLSPFLSKSDSDLISPRQPLIVDRQDPWYLFRPRLYPTSYRQARLSRVSLCQPQTYLHQVH